MGKTQPVNTDGVVLGSITMPTYAVWTPLACASDRYCLRSPHGCHDCDHLFERDDYEEMTQYYCTLAKGKRPPCMSQAMDDLPAILRNAQNKRLTDRVKKAWALGHKKWDAWRKDRERKPWQICDAWKKKP